VSCTRQDLIAFRPGHAYFVAVDSDGCVFDTMELKQRRCFHPLIVSHWRLEAVADAVRETAAFVGLYSRTRGSNRFPALLRVFDLLRRRPDARAAGVPVPDLPALRRFVQSGAALGEPALERAAAETGDPELADVLAWSRAVNACIAAEAGGVRVFPGAAEGLRLMRRRADVLCVSQTPAAALEREWAQHGLADCAALIAGQELGTKAEHIAAAAAGKYRAGRMLVVGDAPGDREAARRTGALFYPINPGREETSWRRLRDEDWTRFLAGEYAGPPEAARIAEFDALLPETPPWEKK